MGVLFFFVLFFWSGSTQLQGCCSLEVRLEESFRPCVGEWACLRPRHIPRRIKEGVLGLSCSLKELAATSWQLPHDGSLPSEGFWHCLEPNGRAQRRLHS